MKDFPLGRAQPTAFGERALRLLSWTASELLRAEDPLEFLHRIYDRMAEALELDGYFHFQVAEPEDRLRLVAWSGVSEEEAEALRWLSMGEAVCGAVAETRREVALSRIQEREEEAVAYVRSMGFTTYFCRPLQVEDRLLGTLSFGSRRLERFPPETMALIRAVGDHVAAALDARRKREALRRQAEALGRAAREKDRFLAMLGHELRNPLAALDAAMRLLERGGEEPERVREVIRAEVAQLTTLVNDLLDIARLTRGAIDLERQEIDLAAVARQAVDSVRAAIEERRQELTIFETGSLRLDADPIRIKQIVVNLLSNATKYTPEGGRIRLEVARDGGQAVLRVVDEGRGIEPEHLETIFEPFARVDRAGDGLGIGLAVARSLAELHGGSLIAVSEGAGRGSTFELRLPLRSRERPRAAPAEKRPSAATSSDGAGVRLLVVDDHQNSADLLALLLRERGYVVDVAYTGEEAVRKGEGFHPHAVLLDLALPDVEGWEVGKTLRERDPDVRLVALTGLGDDRTARRVEEAGFDRMLLKPVDLDALGGILEELVRTG